MSSRRYLMLTALDNSLAPGSDARLLLLLLLLPPPLPPLLFSGLPGTNPTA